MSSGSSKALTSTLTTSTYRRARGALNSGSESMPDPVADDLRAAALRRRIGWGGLFADQPVDGLWVQAWPRGREAGATRYRDTWRYGGTEGDAEY